VKVLDFGVAKSLGLFSGAHATQIGAVLGSPQFMSPEQAKSSADVDHRTDLWALGVILFRCLTGELPFHGREINAVLIEVCTKPIPRPSTIASDLGPDVDAFFERALERYREGRFQTADDLGEAFTALDKSPPTRSSFRPPPPLESSPQP